MNGVAGSRPRAGTVVKGVLPKVASAGREPVDLLVNAVAVDNAEP